MAWWTLPRLVRIGLWSLAGLVLLVIVGGVVIALSFDPDSLKPRIIAAVKQATGRDLTLQGRIRLGLSLQPTLTVQGVAFANPPGFSRPQMATLEQLDLKLALIPLLSHRVEIDRLVLVKPDIILETDGQGRPNWQFTSASSPPTPQPAAGGQAGSQEGAATSISVADVRIENGTITWRDGRAGRSAVLGLTSLRASAPSPNANLALTMSANYNGTPFTLAGEFGSLARLQDRQAGAAWPVQARLEAVGAKLTMDGTVAQPIEGRGYRMELTANVPDMAALGPFVPGAVLPPLHDVSFAARVADTGGALPELSGLTLHVGQSDLTGTVAGLKLGKLDVTAARLDQPVQVSAQASFNNTPATLTGSLGAPAALLQGAKAAAPIPLDLNMQALGSSLTIKGTVARGQDGRPLVQAVARSDKIDLDALLAALPKAPASAGAPAAPPAPTARPAASGRLFPDTPIPFDLLRRADADVQLSVAQLVVGGAVYRAITTHIDLHGGKLRLDPLTGDLPEGHLNATVSVDAAQALPTVALRLQIPALALQPLLVAMKEPGVISGNMQVHADLHGSGATPHAIAATLDGSLGVAMANGTVDNRLLGGTLGSILHQVNLLDLVGRGGTSQVQCFAARLDAAHGIATVRSLVLASSLLTMDGSGSLNLGAETLDLRVRPQAKVAGTGVVVPLRISGPFRSPATAPDPGATITENAGTVRGALLGNTTLLGLAAGALGAKQLSGGVTIDCGAALASTRGASGAVAPAAPAVQTAPQQQPKPPNIGGMLKQLFR